MSIFFQVLKLLILQASWSSLRSLRVSDIMSELFFLLWKFSQADYLKDAMLSTPELSLETSALLVNAFTHTAIFRMQTISL